MPTPREGRLAGLDDRVVPPARRVPDRVAGREAVGSRLDHLAHGHDPVHRLEQRERGEVALGLLLADAQAQPGVHGCPRVAHEDLALLRLGDGDLDDLEVGLLDLPLWVGDQLHFATRHQRIHRWRWPRRR